MICAWQELLHILPPWLQTKTDAHGKRRLEELRLRLGRPPELVCSNENISTGNPVTDNDLNYIINSASRYSPWSAASVSQGYLTAKGGHRIGICGDAVIQSGRLSAIRNIRSICIRVARDFPGIAAGIPDNCSVLIIGSPGTGKTTLMRDLIRQRSDSGKGSIAVVDERGELFPTDFSTGQRTDILTGCSKAVGIPLALRTMGPDTIAVDEISEDADTETLYHAAWCGVHLLATAHARSMSDLTRRPLYQKLMHSGIFQHIVILQKDKSWRTERINL